MSKSNYFKFSLNKNETPSKKKKKLNQTLNKMNETEKKEMLSLLLQISNRETILRVIQPAIEEGYNSAYITLYENYIDGLNDENKEEKINGLLNFIINRYRTGVIKKNKIKDNLNTDNETDDEVFNEI